MRFVIYNTGRKGGLIGTQPSDAAQTRGVISRVTTETLVLINRVLINRQPVDSSK